MALDNGPFKFHAGKYSTDLVANRSVEFLGDAITADKPFFLGITPIGPHAETLIEDSGAVFKAPVPADRHKDLFPDAKVPRTPSFNPDVVSDLAGRGRSRERPAGCDTNHPSGYSPGLSTTLRLCRSLATIRSSTTTASTAAASSRCRQSTTSSTPSSRNSRLTRTFSPTPTSFTPATTAIILASIDCPLARLATRRRTSTSPSSRAGPASQRARSPHSRPRTPILSRRSSSLLASRCTMTLTASQSLLRERASTRRS